MKAILAVDANMGVGVDNKLAFYNKDDLKWFKAFTMGKDCLVGYNTYQHLPNLKGRKIHVLCRGFKESLTPNDLRKMKDYIIIGGAKTYKELADVTSECYITFFNKANPDCNVFVDVYETYKHLTHRIEVYKNNEFRIEKWRAK